MPVFSEKMGLSEPHFFRKDWKGTILSHKILLTAKFCEKDERSTMLPQAILASIWSNIRFECQPRNSSSS